MIMVVLKMIMVMMMRVIFGDDDDGDHFVGEDGDDAHFF